MEEFVVDLTNGNVAEVKVILASVIAALAIYQLVLAAVGYGKIRVPFLANPAALRGHRAIGDTIFALAIITGVMCLSVYGFEDDGGVHAIAGAIVLGSARREDLRRPLRQPQDRPAPSAAGHRRLHPLHDHLGHIGRRLPDRGTMSDESRTTSE